VEQRIAQVEQRVEQLEKQLNQATEQTANQPLVTWSTISQKLKSDEVALEIIRVNEALIPSKEKTIKAGVSYFLLFNSSKGLKPMVFDNGVELEGRSAKYYRNAIASQIDDNLSYDKFWKPIKLNMAGSKRIYLSTDGVFAQINLNTLRNPVSEKYVIDEAEVVYLTNTRDLLKSTLVKSTNTAFLFGRPAYAAEPSGSTGTFRSLANEELYSLTEQEFSDLPGTEQEINTAYNSLANNAWQVKRYLGTDATEANVKALKSPRLLHIATHGFFIGDTTGSINPMIRSGLLFSGVSNKSNEEQDGILTAYEAALLNLENTDLVILSACETGLGEIRNGEGVYGLQRAIMASGTKNLLMSLWKVDDQATNLLMGNFYEAWNKSMATGEAFREAQKAIRQKYPHPYYWGAFVLLGK
jgi:CHAT domain-containing protein